MSTDSVDRATRLLRFLARARHLTDRPVRDVREYPVLWLDDLPHHRAVTRREDDLETDRLVVRVSPVPANERPAVPPELAPWVGGDVDRPQSRPRLRRKAVVKATSTIGRTVLREQRLADRPDLRSPWATWYAAWQEWSERERDERPARLVHERLLTAVTTARDDIEHELVLGVGLLTCGTGEKTVRRHAFTVPLTGTVADDGRLTLRVDAYAPGLSVELDMLGPTDSPPAEALASLRAAARDISGSPLDETAMAGLAHALTTALPTDAPAMSWSPAIILRPRTPLPAAVHRLLADGIETTGRIPGALMPLVAGEGAAGAVVDGPEFDESAAQLEVVSPFDRFHPMLEHTEHHRQSVIRADDDDRAQATAAVLTHHLARGRRVLVVAPEVSSLLDVRAAVPAELRPLLVTTGSDPDAGDLVEALDTLTRQVGEHDRVTVARTLATADRALTDLRLERRLLLDQAVLSREKETLARTHDGRCGTLTELVRNHRAEADSLEWLAELVDVSPGAAAPMTATDLRRFLELTRDRALRDLTPDARGHRPDRTDLPTPPQFARLVGEFETAAESSSAYTDDPDDTVFQTLLTADPVRRSALRTALDTLVFEVRAAAAFPGEWIAGAVRDLRSPRPGAWHEAADVLGAMLESATALVDAVGHEISVLGDVEETAARARYLREHLRSGAALTVDARGIPVAGVDRGDAVQAATPLFRYIRVDGHPPTNLDDLDALLRHLEAEDAIDDLDRLWPDGTVIPDDSSPRARLAWHTTHLEHFRRVVELRSHVATATELLTDLGLMPPDWTDDDAVDALATRVAAADAHAATARAARPLTDLAIHLGREDERSEICDAARRLHDAAATLDTRAYADAWARLDALDDAAERLAEAARLTARVEAHLPRLAAALREDPDDPVWDSRLPSFDDAWRWCRTDAWLADHRAEDPDAFAAELARLDTEIRRHARTVLIASAWTHAATPGRLATTTRIDLMLRSHLRRRASNGGATLRHRDELARISRRCRDAVPGWLVPATRLVDQVDVTRDRFDVVIVDDASGVGLEATHLRLLASLIVLVGDGHHTVGHEVDPDVRARIGLLADRYLRDDPHRDTWRDASPSLFTDAVRRAGVDVDLTDAAPEDSPSTALTDAPGFVRRIRDVLAAHGYAVAEDSVVRGRRVDLVVNPAPGQGHAARPLAIVGEPDTWNGPADYEASLLHQRVLEDDGWTVHRLRESEFELDPARAFAIVHRVLRGSGIRPGSS